jgi:hypothetical protein
MNEQDAGRNWESWVTFRQILLCARSSPWHVIATGVPREQAEAQADAMKEAFVHNVEGLPRFIGYALVSAHPETRLIVVPEVADRHGYRRHRLAKLEWVDSRLKRHKAGWGIRPATDTSS